MILRNKLHQSCVHKRRLTADFYGDPVFDEGTDTICRREDTQRLVLDQRGREVMSSARFFLAGSVEPGDTLDGRIVLSVTALTGMFGRVEGFEASCL